MVLVPSCKLYNDFKYFIGRHKDKRKNTSLFSKCFVKCTVAIMGEETSRPFCGSQGRFPIDSKAWSSVEEMSSSSHRRGREGRSNPGWHEGHATYRDQERNQCSQQSGEEGSGRSWKVCGGQIVERYGLNLGELLKSVNLWDIQMLLWNVLWIHRFISTSRKHVFSYPTVHPPCFPFFQGFANLTRDSKRVIGPFSTCSLFFFIILKKPKKARECTSSIHIFRVFTLEIQ